MKFNLLIALLFLTSTPPSWSARLRDNSLHDDSSPESCSTPHGIDTEAESLTESSSSPWFGGFPVVWPWPSKATSTTIMPSTLAPPGTSSAASTDGTLTPTGQLETTTTSPSNSPSVSCTTAPPAPEPTADCPLGAFCWTAIVSFLLSASVHIIMFRAKIYQLFNRATNKQPKWPRSQVKLQDMSAKKLITRTSDDSGPASSSEKDVLKIPPTSNESSFWFLSASCQSVPSGSPINQMTRMHFNFARVWFQDEKINLFHLSNCTALTLLLCRLQAKPSAWLTRVKFNSLSSQVRVKKCTKNRFLISFA